MPTRGVCHSCGETAFLQATVVQHKEDGHMECWMICQRCREWYKSQIRNGYEFEKQKE